MSVVLRPFRCVTALLLLLVAWPAAAQNGFPVVTHYPMRGGVTPDTSRAAMPSYENYSAARSDEYAPPRQEFDTALQLMFQATNQQVRMMNDPAELMEGATQIQVVNNWQIGAALYTVAVPVGWRRNVSLPIVLSGNPTGYSNNFRLFRAQEAGLLAFTASKGFIVAYSNAGGIESQGISDNVLRSVGEAITTLAGLGGDKDRVVTSGFSRGAATAFVWAANPLDLDYTVIAVFGQSLPTSTLEAVTAPYATYPLLGWLADTITNDTRASRYTSSPPPHAIPNRVLQILTGQGTMETKSAFANLERLRGKQLVYSVATHDAIVPYRTGVAFTRALADANIPAMAVLVQNSGHAFSNDVVNELTRALDLIGTNRPYVAPAGRVYAVDNDTQNHDYTRQTRINRATMPFSIVLPYRAARGQAMRVDMCGAPGAQVIVCGVEDIAGEEEPVPATVSEIFFAGAIPPEECVSVALPAPLVVANYQWTIMLNGLALSRTLSPFSGHKPRLEVLSMQPGNFDGLVTALPVAEGFSEVSPQFGGEMRPCPPPAHVPASDAGFDDTGFNIGLRDAQSADAAGTSVLDSGVRDTGNRKPPDPSCGCESTGGSPPISLFVAFALFFAWKRRR